MKIEIFKKNTGKLSSKNIRKLRVRSKIKSVNYGKLRLSIFKSNKNIEAQLIDDIKGQTLCAVSSLQEFAKDCKNKMEASEFVGNKIAEIINEKKIDNNSIFFDRGAYRYHGRVAALISSFQKYFENRSSQ